MKNFFAVALGLSILILALAGAYYLVVYIPNRDTALLEAKQAQENRQEAIDRQKALDQQDCANRVIKVSPPTTDIMNSLLSICMKQKGY